ncbi:MAG TPA: hypothetical protein VIL97_11475 [Thermoanaerobaculia bacterium]
METCLVSDDDLKRHVRRNPKESASAHAETRRLFETTGEKLRHEIDLVAEGAADTREALARESAGIREEVRRTGAETQAMIEFSHAELDR